MSNITDRLNLVLKNLNNQIIADNAYKFFKEITPKRTGNARNNTRLSNNTIDADYPYALKLDEGSSKKAPEGMTEPTIKYIREYIFKKLG